MKGMILTLIPERMSICRTGPREPLPDWLPESGLWSLTRTTEELSLVISETLAPQGWQVEGGWRCLKVEGPLDFSLTGILSALTAPLAAAGIAVFAISTYDTDYLLVKQKDLEQTLIVLAQQDFNIKP